MGTVPAKSVRVVLSAAALVGGLLTAGTPMPAGAAVISEFPVPTASSGLSGVAYGPDGNVWATESSGNKIAQVTSSGLVTEFAIPTPSALPNGIAAGPDGNLWFTESGVAKIGKITPGGTVTEYTAGITASSEPWEITAGPDGNLWFTERAGNQIGKITTTGTVTEYSAGITAAGKPSYIASDGTNLWFTEKAASKVAKITTSGVVTEYATTTASSGPSGITLGPDGNLWWTEFTSNQIGTMHTDGTHQVEYPTGMTGVTPKGITSAADGNLWFDAIGQDAVGRISTAGVVTPFRIPTFMSHPVDITSGTDKNVWFVESAGNNVAQILVDGSTSFYFAEGNTLPGFTENLYLFMPNHSGDATIDYYLSNGTHPPTTTRTLTAGQTLVESVNTDVGAGVSGVAVKVTLPNPGVVERTEDYNLGLGHGAFDIVGVAQPHMIRYYSEGSTLPGFKEYLTLVNTNSSSVVTDLDYFTDSGQHPVKTLTLPATSRTTIEVFSGDLNNNSSCTPGGGGTCGVGPGIGGVSVEVVAHGLPIISERPLYVQTDFGDGPIIGGHDDFGTENLSLDWHFAEGTTLFGFREYLSVLNPTSSPASDIQLTYSLDDGTVVVKDFSLAADTRATIEVFNGSTTSGTCTPPACGVGRGHAGVSVDVLSQGTSPPELVVERPIYEYEDFGSGPLGGAHVVVGALDRSNLWGFANANTSAMEYDFLSLQNPQAAVAHITVSYYAAATPVTKTFTINPHTRATVEIFKGDMTGTPTSPTACAPLLGTCGVGRSYSHFGVVVSSDQRILVEKPTYSTAGGSFGATDTLGYPAATFS